MNASTSDLFEVPVTTPALKTILEAALLAADEPLSIERLQGLVNELTPSRQAIRTALAELALDYHGRGIQLCEVASGFRFQVPIELSFWVSRLRAEPIKRYSRAFLETLVIIAYRQPITRGEIEEIRGVSLHSNLVNMLLEQGWITVLGHRNTPGHPALYGTTRFFLDYFNLKNLNQLPPLNEVMDGTFTADNTISG